MNAVMNKAPNSTDANTRNQPEGRQPWATPKFAELSIIEHTKTHFTGTTDDGSGLTS